MESILTSIKKLLGVGESYTEFDADIVMHINSVFMILTQMGVGPSEGFSIEDDTTTWNEFIPDLKNFEAVKTYVYLKVKLIFDTPDRSSVVESTNRMISELEWRLYAAASTPVTNGEEDQNGD